MLIKTTIHIHENILQMLNKTVEKTGRSRSFIIKVLLQRVMCDNQKMLKPFSRIKYQARDVKDNWHRFHITLSEYEYEYCLDMRKFFKMSVSFILASAVRKYLDEVTSKLVGRGINTDNYLYKNYIFIKETIDETICWKLYWGIPKNLPNIISD